MLTLADVVRELGVVWGAFSLILAGCVCGALSYPLMKKFVKAIYIKIECFAITCSGIIISFLPLFCWPVDWKLVLMFCAQFIFIAILCYSLSETSLKRRIMFGYFYCFMMSIIGLAVSSYSLNEFTANCFDNKDRVSHLKTWAVNNKQTDVKFLIDNLSKYAEEDPDCWYFISRLLANKNERVSAAGYMKKYAAKFSETDVKKMAFFNGISWYWLDEYARAAEDFESAGEPHLALSVLHFGKLLEKDKFFQLANNITGTFKIGADTLANIKNVYGWNNEEKIKNPVVPQNSEYADIILRLDSIEKKMNVSMKSGDAIVQKIDNASVGLMNFAVLSDTPDIPGSGFKEKADVAQLLYLAAVAIFLFPFYTVVIIMDACKTSFSFDFLGRILEKISRHSFAARKISVRIALMEKKKGVFDSEISAIRRNFFPVDLILALWYLRRARQADEFWEVSSREKEDLAFIVREIRKLAGVLIPNGNEESFAIIRGLHEKAAGIFDNYRKNGKGYEKKREVLLEILSELAIVGDILGARTNGHISAYDILGVGKEAGKEEIKSAYREIMKAVHPDCNSGKKHIAGLAGIVNGLYETLSDPVRRKAYDLRAGF